MRGLGRVWRWVCGAVMGVAIAVDAGAAETSPTERILQQEFKQQQIRSTTQRVGDQLDAIVAEFERNGLSGEDVTVLKAIRSVLGSLTEKEMQMVVTYLQQARAATDPAASAREATSAFASQKRILIQLQQLEAEYRRQKELYELSLRLRELADRQSANMWLGVNLSNATATKSFNTFDESQKISLRFQQTDQAPRKDELMVVLKRLEQLTKEVVDGPTAERPRTALERVKEGGVIAALDAAVEELRDDKLKLANAIASERKARDEMRELARLLVLAANPLEALRQAIRDVDRVMDEETRVRAETRKLEKKDEAEKRGQEQAEVADHTDLIRKDVDSLAPIAAEYLKSATSKMESARKALNEDKAARQRRDATVPLQDEAMLNLSQARQALEEQLAAAEQRVEQPQSTLAALQQLQKDVRELMKRQEALKKETAATERKDLLNKAPKQGDLKDQAQELQSKAASPSPKAAQSLGEAASEMQRAQNSLASSQNNAPAQQAALDALQRADEQLQEDIARLEQAEQDLADLEDLLRRLTAIIEAQQDTQFATIQEAIKTEVEPMPKLSAQQEELRTATAQLKLDTAKPAPNAASHLGNAEARMAEAITHLEKPAPKPAELQQTKALTELYIAKRELEAQMDALREMLGQPPSESPDEMADAQEMIEKALQEVNKALSELQEGQPGLMDMLQQQQQKIAEGLEKICQNAGENAPKAASRRNAQKSAKAAAEQLKKFSLPRALDAMKQAQAAMKECQGGAPKEASLDELAEQQSQVQQAVEKLMSAQQAKSSGACQRAGQSLQRANKQISPLTSGAKGRMPRGAQSALESAQSSCSQGSAQAQAGQCSGAMQSASDAAEALAQAQAALALAQAGLGSQPGQGQGQQPGPGQTPGQGKGKGQRGGKPSPRGTGDGGNWTGPGGGEGERGEVAGSSSFQGLPKRDRAALLQSQGEKYPQEFGALVEQYLKNLSDQAGPK